MKHNLTRTHGIVLLALFVAFTVLTFLVTNAGVDKGSDHNALVLQATLGTITGPLTGAISRGFQDCCLAFSLTVMAYCAPFLLIGVGIQFVGSPEQRWLRVTRMVLWVLGWIVWFMGGILSFGHALS